MIKFIFLNWKFSESDYLYSTEIIEEDLVIELIKKLEKLSKEYNLETVHPISQIFDVYQEMEISKITKFLEDCLTNCQIDSESDMEAYRRLLGQDLRHGPAIFQEISEIVDSLLTGGGKYDPVYLIRDFLNNPWDGCSEICRKAIEEACQALAGNRRREQEHGTWCVGDFLGVVGIETSGIDQKILSQNIHVFQDDGRGYGAVSGPCTFITTSVNPDTGQRHVGIWM
jgi:hypothetical protein